MKFNPEHITDLNTSILLHKRFGTTTTMNYWVVARVFDEEQDKVITFGNGILADKQMIRFGLENEMNISYNAYIFTELLSVIKNRNEKLYINFTKLLDFNKPLLIQLVEFCVRFLESDESNDPPKDYKVRRFHAQKGVLNNA